MNTNQEIVAEAARGWSDIAAEGLLNVVYRGIAGLEAFLAPEIVESIAKSLSTFLFIFAELTVLFLVISYGISLLQQYIPAEKIQWVLGKKRGYALAALLGAITPFCSCSTIPFLKGLIRAGAGFGGIIVFLLASPLLNPIIIGLFFISFGAKVAIYYFVVAMLFSILAGWILEKRGFARYVREIEEENPIGCACGGEAVEPAGFGARSADAWKSAVGDFRGALKFMVLGVAIGSVIYGFVPDAFIAEHAGGDSPFAVPIAAVVGVPLYVRAEAVIPISLGLVGKGMSLGAVMAFIIGSAGASLTEVVLLKALFKNPIIIAFLIVVFTMAIAAGYLLPFVL